MQKITFSILVAGLLSINLVAQVCDPTVAPTGLTSTYTEGSGVLLEWDAVPGSVGVQVKVSSLFDGSVFTQRNIAFERDWLLIPEDRFITRSYYWQVQAACSTVFPYNVTPISAANWFTAVVSSSCPATVTDIDGNVYNIVQIGTQCWMQENLKVEHYQNGTAIPSGLSNSDWETTFSGASAVYNNVAANKAIYGLLYNWHAVVDSNGLCPTGWHVPTDGEWTVLTSYLGGPSAAGGQMKTTGTLSSGTGLWQAPNTWANNNSGFSGLPGGSRFWNGFFNYRGSFGYWWSSSEIPTSLGFIRRLSYDSSSANRDAEDKQEGYSIRCLQDE